MIQFNLLPDVKLDYIKARRTKRMVLVMSTLVGGAALTILILLFVVVNVFQKQHLKDLQKDIKAASKKLQDTPDLNKILTVQNQLQSLPGLHDDKPVISRLFGYTLQNNPIQGYITQTTPANVAITTYNIDYAGHTIGIDGNAPSLSEVNKFVDTLKFTDYTDQASGQTASKKAFSNVVLASFAKDDKGATYHLDLSFDPDIFSNSKQIVLNVPKITTTRSETEKPSEVFQSKPTSQ